MINADPLLNKQKPFVVKKKQSKLPFSYDTIEKIVEFGYPMEDNTDTTQKLYKSITKYRSRDGKTHSRTIYFGHKKRRGCEYIDHKNKEVRDMYLKTIPADKSKKFYDEFFMDKHILNGEEDDLTKNWKILKDKYVN